MKRYHFRRSPNSRRVQLAAYPLGEFPQEAVWFDRMQALEAWKKTQP